MNEYRQCRRILEVSPQGMMVRNLITELEVSSSFNTRDTLDIWVRRWGRKGKYNIYVYILWILHAALEKNHKWILIISKL